MERREFLQWSGLAGASLLAHPVSWSGSLTPIPTADRKALANVALDAARSQGASYADVRIGRYLNQFINGRETVIQGIVSTESYGVGIRVIAKGTWGFAATEDVTPDGIAACAAQAVALARANARLQAEPVALAPQHGVGEVSWKTPVERNALDVPMGEKCDLLLAVGAAALAAGANYIYTGLFLVNEQKYFASTDGSYIDQDIQRTWPSFQVTVIDKSTGRFEQRRSLAAPMGCGWEYLSMRPGDRIISAAGVPVYGSRYDMLEDARLAPSQAKEKAAAKSVTPGSWDLVLDPSHLWLTIHESVGHPLELDRVLGYEANYAGTSFATLDKWRSGSFQYGATMVNFVADRTQPGSLQAAGWDDEGVPTRQWDLVRNGVLVNYQAIRDQVHVLGLDASLGCCAADSWRSVQFQRMPNVSLLPGPAPLTPAEMIAGVEQGIYIIGDGSYSIDQQRYNFQFGGVLFYEIRNGKIVGMLRDAAYQANTVEFWNAVTGICDRRDYRLGGSFFDGKGQPPQISAVSHGCSTTRIDRVNVLNTARTLPGPHAAT
jgi:TldD protein